MPGFRKCAQGGHGWLLWVGDPDDNAAHQEILSWLQGQNSQFEGPNTAPSNHMKGNLGEFIAYNIGRHYVAPAGARAFTANAFDPIVNNSRTEVDVLWVNLSGNPTQDSVTIQEVKTTGSTSLSLADGLISDYEKLFGQNLKLSLRTRLSSLKNPGLQDEPAGPWQPSSASDSYWRTQSGTNQRSETPADTRPRLVAELAGQDGGRTTGHYWPRMAIRRH